jgi:hypothetical protein
MSILMIVNASSLRNRLGMTLGILLFALGCVETIPEHSEHMLNIDDDAEPVSQETKAFANTLADQDELEIFENVVTDPILQAALEFASKKMYVLGGFTVSNGLGIPPVQIVEDYRILRRDKASRVVFYFWESEWAEDYLRQFHEQYPGCPKDRELELLPPLLGGFPLYFTVTVDRDSLRIVKYYASIQ